MGRGYPVDPDVCRSRQRSLVSGIRGNADERRGHEWIVDDPAAGIVCAQLGDCRFPHLEGGNSTVQRRATAAANVRRKRWRSSQRLTMTSAAPKDAAAARTCSRNARGSTIPVLASASQTSPDPIVIDAQAFTRRVTV